MASTAERSPSMASAVAALISNKSLNELEETLAEKRSLLDRITGLTTSLPRHVASLRNNIHTLKLQVQALESELSKHESTLSRSGKGATTLRAILIGLQQEIDARKAAQPELVDLTENDWRDLEALQSLSDEPVSDATSLHPTEAVNISSTPQRPTMVNKGRTSTLLLAEAINDIRDQLVSVSASDDQAITRAVVNRWQIARGTNGLKATLAGYATRIPRSFSVMLPGLEIGSFSETVFCVVCRTVIDGPGRAKLLEACSVCYYHPKCAAVHLDYSSGPDGTPSEIICVAKVFGKCPCIVSSANDQESRDGSSSIHTRTAPKRNRFNDTG